MSLVYQKGIEQMGLGNIDLEGDTIKLAFMDPAYTPDGSTDQFWSDVSGSIASGTSAQTLTSLAFDIDTGNNRVEFDADDVSIGSQTTSTDKVVVYKDTGTASTSPLICTLDITEGTLSPVDGTLSLTFDAEGLFSISST